jgi:hypothetical protein
MLEDSNQMLEDPNQTPEDQNQMLEDLNQMLEHLNQSQSIQVGWRGSESGPEHRNRPQPAVV